MDIKRLLSAILGLPIVIAIFLFGNKYLIDISMAVVAIISLHEYYNAFSEYKTIRWIGYLTATLISIIHFIPNLNIFATIGISVPIIIILLFIELIIKNLKINIVDLAISLIGIFYVVLFILFIPLLICSENGKILIWYAIIAAWGTDTCAYMAGKVFKLGKHKFSKISPNKSIEGCVSGLVGTVLLTVLYTFCLKHFNIIDISYIKIIIISIILSIIGQFGDFSASSIKRFVGIKDYSNLIPGHGGLLDRIDSLIFIAPIAYILFIGI